MSGTTSSDPAPTVVIEQVASKSKTGTPVASGVLVDARLVVIPDPPAQLIQAKDHLRAVISVRHNGQRSDESIRVADVHPLGQRAAGTSSFRAAVLELKTPSRHAIKVSEFDNSHLATLLVDNQGDLWATLRDLGYQLGTNEDPDPNPDPEPGITPTTIVEFCEGLCDWLPCCRSGHESDSA